MLPSTRVCMATNCQATTRLISSIKELDNHKGHSSSSLGQIQTKLKSYSIQTCEPVSKLIQSKCEMMRTMINKLQEQLLQQVQKYDLYETVQAILNSNFSSLKENSLDQVIRNLSTVEKQMNEIQSDYVELKNQIETSLDNQITNMIKIFRKKLPTNSASKLATIQEQSPSRSIDYSPKFLQNPISYEKVTKVIFAKENKRAKHVDGCYTMVLTDQIINQNGSAEIDFKMISIQKGYVGVGLGIVLKSRIATKGLILQFDEMQEAGHGVYMVFNDKCIYNHSDAKLNGVENGRQKGIDFKDGDIVKVQYNGNKQLLKFTNNEQIFEMSTSKEEEEYVFAVWLDLSEVEIL